VTMNDKNRYQLLSLYANQIVDVSKEKKVIQLTSKDKPPLLRVSYNILSPASFSSFNDTQLNSLKVMDIAKQSIRPYSEVRTCLSSN